MKKTIESNELIKEFNDFFTNKEFPQRYGDAQAFGKCKKKKFAPKREQKFVCIWLMSLRRIKNEHVHKNILLLSHRFNVLKKLISKA